jgi:hypothetical protein
LRADGVGEANRHITTAQVEKRRKDEEPQGRCHQLSGCVSCTWPLFRRSRQLIGRVLTPPRWRLDKGGRQAFGHPGGLTLALRLQQRKHLKDRKSLVSTGRFGVREARGVRWLLPSGRSSAKSSRDLSLISSFGWMPDENFGFPTVEIGETRRWP